MYPPVHISAEAPPEELFRPLLTAALQRGVTAASPAGGHPGDTGGDPGYAERALLAEEVLVYQRAAARLAELTGSR